jgi:hypothetical protein
MQSDEWNKRLNIPYKSTPTQYLFCWNATSNQWEIQLHIKGFKLLHQRIHEYELGIPSVLSYDIWYDDYEKGKNWVVVRE